MYKPEVRITQEQQIDNKSVQVTSSEAADLLAKYGYSTQNIDTDIQSTRIKSDLTAEEMYAQYDRELELQRKREIERRNMPKSITFDSRNINYTSTDYRSLDDGFGIQVQVVSDMPINNGRR